VAEPAAPSGPMVSPPMGWHARVTKSSPTGSTTPPRRRRLIAPTGISGTVCRVVTEFGNYQLDDEPTRVDRDAVWCFLSSQACWGRWRTRQDVERQLDSAWRVVGVYDVAVARDRSVG
jgi:hypothetical protein